jgi:hypothetical protein
MFTDPSDNASTLAGKVYIGVYIGFLGQEKAKKKS